MKIGLHVQQRDGLGLKRCDRERKATRRAARRSAQPHQVVWCTMNPIPVHRVAYFQGGELSPHTHSQLSGVEACVVGEKFI